MLLQLLPRSCKARRVKMPVDDLAGSLSPTKKAVLGMLILGAYVARVANIGATCVCASYVWCRFSACNVCGCQQCGGGGIWRPLSEGQPSAHIYAGCQACW